MKKISGVMLVVIVLFFVKSTAFANFAQDVSLLNIAGANTMLSSSLLDCALKKKINQHITMETKQELFRQLGGNENAQNNNILAKSKRVLTLMNKVFFYEGAHEWGERDSRTLDLVWSMWIQAIDPKCFDGKTNGFSSEEWLRGAEWAMQQKK